MNEFFTAAGNFLARDPNKVDAQLRAIIEEAAKRAGRRVEAFSGYRPGDKRLHGKGAAMDVRLFDEAGKMIPNYQSAKGFQEYEKLAQIARQVQMEKYPDLANKFRWGGYFSGGPGKYGALDAMHFDLGGGPNLGMAGGSWEGGLTAAQRKLFPGINSIGLNLNTVPKVPTAPTGSMMPPPGPVTPMGMTMPPPKPITPAGMMAPPSGIPKSFVPPVAAPVPTMTAGLGGFIGGLGNLVKAFQGGETAKPPEPPPHRSLIPEMEAGDVARRTMATQMFQNLLAQKKRPMRGLTLGSL